jgi:5'-nucleotidase
MTQGDFIMRKHLLVPSMLLLLSLLVMFLPQVGLAQGTFSLTILHTNDTHSHLEEFDNYGGSCDEDETCYGGVARRNYQINMIREGGGNVLLVDGGDAFQGTLYFNEYHGVANLHFMNHLGYQGMAVGNHEFDLGPDPLGHFASYANFPVLSANLDVSSEPALAGLVQPYTTVNVGGETIGLIGLTTEDVTIISNIGSNVKVKDPTSSAQEAVAALQAQGVNKIVLLSHMGYGPDNALATTVAGIDVVVGGHSHTLLGTMAGAEGPYPNAITSPAGEPVLVVQAGSWGEYLGRLDVTFDTNGVITGYGGEPILLDNSIPKDAEVEEALMTQFAPALDALKSTVVGQTSVDLDGERNHVRGQETNLGNLVCDAMLWATRSDNTQVCLTNGGGIRASVGAGDVTMGDVLSVHPFGNTLVDLDLTGAQIIEALENGVSEVEEGSGRFSQVGGMRYTFNPDLPSGSRIILVEVMMGDGYQTLDPNKSYRLVTNNFLFGGGDGYSVFEQGTGVYETGVVLSDAIGDYIKAFSPVSPQAEGRINMTAALLPETGTPVAWVWVLAGAAAVTGVGLTARYASRRRRVA